MFLHDHNVILAIKEKVAIVSECSKSVSRFLLSSDGASLFMKQANKRTNKQTNKQKTQFSTEN